MTDPARFRAGFFRGGKPILFQSLRIISVRANRVVVTTVLGDRICESTNEPIDRLAAAAA